MNPPPYPFGENEVYTDDFPSVEKNDTLFYTVSFNTDASFITVTTRSTDKELSAVTHEVSEIAGLKEFLPLTRQGSPPLKTLLIPIINNLTRFFGPMKLLGANIQSNTCRWTGVHTFCCLIFEEGASRNLLSAEHNPMWFRRITIVNEWDGTRHGYEPIYINYE